MVLAAVAAVLAVYFVTDAKYNDAIALLDDDNPQDAAKVFEELEEFKESPEYLQDCIILMDYYEATDTLEDGKYEEAISMFAALGNYEDSPALQQLAQQNFDYETAKALYDKGALEQAKSAYMALGAFKESIEMVKTCQIELDYIEATTLFDTGQFLEAMNIFNTIPEYLDSKDKSFICDCKLNFEDALDEIDGERYSAAVSALQKIEADITKSDVEFSETIPFKEIKYYLGVAFFEQELFYSAYMEFSDASGVFDAASKADECSQPIKSVELYENPDYARNSVSMTFKAPKGSGISACVKVYTEDGILVSTSLIEADKKLRIKLPKGTYTFNIGRGYEWYGIEEAFGDIAYYGTMIMDAEGGITWKLTTRYRYFITMDSGDGEGYPSIPVDSDSF